MRFQSCILAGPDPLFHLNIISSSYHDPVENPVQQLETPQSGVGVYTTLLCVHYSLNQQVFCPRTLEIPLAPLLWTHPASVKEQNAHSMAATDRLGYHLAHLLLFNQLLV